jgi:5-methylcytosine-specific restriction endonuclease McrA
MLTKSCLTCGKHYPVRPYRFDSALYCSKRCYGLSEKGRIPKSAFKKGNHTRTEFQPGDRHPYFGRSSPALGKKWGNSGCGRSLHYELTHRPEYRGWRKKVFQRDNFTCQTCGVVGGKLHAHHIRPYRLFPELIFYIDNGQTLCVPCHYKTDTYGKPKSPKTISH